MMKHSNWDIGVCSWSLKDDFKLLSKLKNQLEVSTVHLRICPNFETACSIKKMQDNGWNISSAMVNFPQEDYSTLDSIKQTGGILPSEYWPQNRKRVLDAIDIIADTSIEFLSFHFGFLEKTNTDLIVKIIELADYAADKRKILLMETGQETAQQLAEFIQLLDHKAIAVNFDPANMILYNKGNPIESLKILKPWIKHIHIKDAIASSQPNQWGKEVPWNQGQVNAKDFLNKLREIDYQGTLCVERESGNNRYNDIASAIQSIRKHRRLACVACPQVPSCNLSANHTNTHHPAQFPITNKIKIAIVGLGKMGHYHLNAINQLKAGHFEPYYKSDANDLLKTIELIGLCDISPDQTKTLTDTKIYSSYQELIESASPDILIIATPTETHFPIAKFALNNNVNVFVEKPIVTKTQQLETLLKIADQKNLKLMAGHVERYNPVAMKIRELLSEYKNSAKNFTFSRLQKHHPRIHDDIIIDKLIHDLDLSLFLFGDIKDFKILESKKVDGRVQELRLSLTHKNSTGEIFVSWLKETDTVRKLDLEFDDKKIAGDFYTKILSVNRMPIDCEIPSWIQAQNNQIKDELVDFIVYCFSKSSDVPDPLLSLKEISFSTKIIEEISSTLSQDR